MPMYSLHFIKTLETRQIKRFPAKTFTNVGMVQRVIKNRVHAPTHHTNNKIQDTRRGSLASLAIHNPCRSRFIAFKRLCIHCTQVNILRLQVTLKPLSPSLHLATSFCANYSSNTIVSTFNAATYTATLCDAELHTFCFNHFLARYI